MALLAMLGERRATGCRTPGHGAMDEAIDASAGWPRERRDFARLCALLHDSAWSECRIGCSPAAKRFRSRSRWRCRVIAPRRAHRARPSWGLALLRRGRPGAPRALRRTWIPDGLAGREIPAEARLIAVASSFQAMVEDRPAPARLARARGAGAAGARPIDAVGSRRRGRHASASSRRALRTTAASRARRRPTVPTMCTRSR